MSFVDIVKPFEQHNMPKALKILFILQIYFNIDQVIGGGCDCLCGNKGRFTRIVGGQDAKTYDHPWTTALLKNNVVYCGATIVSSMYLLTAAHCVYSFRPEDISVYVGVNDLSDKGSSTEQDVSSVVSHEYFNAVNFNNDIGLIKVHSPLVYGPKIQPACLPTGSPLDYSGQLGVVSGWGRVGENLDQSQVLKFIKIPIWPENKCYQSGYGEKRLNENVLCAGYEEGLFDACQGDSGGSMVRELSSGSMEIVGIISWGRGCARPNFPGIYTKVANYKDWIMKHLSYECICSPKA